MNIVKEVSVILVGLSPLSYTFRFSEFLGTSLRNNLAYYYLLLVTLVR